MLDYTIIVYLSILNLVLYTSIVAASMHVLESYNLHNCIIMHASLHNYAILYTILYNCIVYICEGYCL